mmetsp:Transcript_20240/g.47798  ORF Transcript_20240/g.47798 Transcript_20240/m.47798 type:complete len:206 (+) Transcript_20240:279-896(+)
MQNSHLRWHLKARKMTPGKIPSKNHYLPVAACQRPLLEHQHSSATRKRRPSLPLPPPLHLRQWYYFHHRQHSFLLFGPPHPLNQRIDAGKAPPWKQNPPSCSRRKCQRHPAGLLRGRPPLLSSSFGRRQAIQHLHCDCCYQYCCCCLYPRPYQSDPRSDRTPPPRSRPEIPYPGQRYSRSSHQAQHHPPQPPPSPPLQHPPADAR